MKPIASLLLLAFLVVPCVNAAPSTSSGQAKPHQDATARCPNILFIFADDFAFDSIGAAGNTEVQTPNLDQLAARGVSFTHAYNMGAWHGAVCVASRTMLNTGKFLWRANSTKADDVIPHNGMWSQMLAGGGYDTYFTGKWHNLGDPVDIFGTAMNVRPGMPNQTPEGYNRPLSPEDKNWTPWDKKFEGFWQGGKHWSEVVGDDGTTFLQSAAKSDKPFFIYAAFNAPHDPRQSPKEFVDRYPLDKISLPQPFLEEYPYEVGSNHIRDEKLAPFPRTEYAVKVNRQEYYAIITHMDEQVGRILEALEKSGKADNTYIFFSADHGLAVGHHGFMGKQNMYDHSLRVPFFVVGPGVPEGVTRDAPIYLQDIMATSLDLAGIEKPAQVEFKSLLPLIADESARNYERIYGAYTTTQRMITEGDHKLIVYPKIGVKRLYNLKDDPLELKDLAGDAANADLIASLTASLKELQAEMGDELDLDNPAPAKAKTKEKKGKKEKGKPKAAK